MKKIISILPIITTILLTSCTKLEKTYIEKNCFYIDKDTEITTYSSIMTSVDTSNIISMMKSGQSFALYCGTSSCVHCNSAKPNIISYLKEYGTQMYYYDTSDTHFFDENGWDQVVLTSDSKLPATYNLGTPSIFFMDGTTVKSKIEGSQQLSRKVTAANAIRARVNETCTYAINSFDDYQRFIEHEKTFVASVISSSADTGIQFFNAFKKDYYSSKRTNAYIKLDLFSKEDVTLLSNELKVDLTKTCALTCDNGELKVYENAYGNKSIGTIMNKFLY